MPFLVSEVSGGLVRRYSLVSGDGVSARHVFRLLSYGFSVPVPLESETLSLLSSHFRLHNPWWVEGARSAESDRLLALVGFEWSPILTKFL